MKAFNKILFILLGFSPSFSHVVDLHLPTATEIMEEHRREERRDANTSWDTFNDSSRSDSERQEALKDLNDKGEVV